MLQGQIRTLLRYDPNDPDWKWTSAFVECVPDKDAFDALFPIAIRAQTSGETVLAAAIVLRRRKPQSSLPCSAVVRALLQEWDVSIDELPFYLVESFGAETVRDAIAEVEKDFLTEAQSTRL